MFCKNYNQAAQELQAEVREVPSSPDRGWENFDVILPQVVKELVWL